MNRTRQNRGFYPRYQNTKPPKTIYTGDIFPGVSVIAPDPKTFPLPPREWFQLSEQS